LIWGRFFFQFLLIRMLKEEMKKTVEVAETESSLNKDRRNRVK
jgi:hypothetical protein